MWPDEQEPSSRWEDPDEDRWPTSSNDRGVPVTPTQPTTQPRVQRWVSALAASWQAARWWLARKPGRYPVLTALAIGLAAGVATLAGGPLAAAGMTLIGTAMGLLSLAQVAGNAASAVAGILSS